jgi:DNA-directed RNA polymerase subunit N (RpoN/RPB10)
MNSKNFFYYPVRCQCNRILGDKQTIIENMKKQGISINEIFKKLNINRLCCRLRLIEPAIQLKSLDYTYNIDPELINFFKEQETSTKSL